MPQGFDYFNSQQEKSKMSEYLVCYVIQCADGSREYGDRIFPVNILSMTEIERVRDSIRAPNDCEVVFLSWIKLEASR